MGIASLPVFLLFLSPAAPAGAQAESAWPVNETQHFTIHHESLGAELGDYAKIKRVYESLHGELRALVPWMATEKTSIYIYKDVDSYRRGRFHPPSWSGGLLETSGGEKSLAIFEPVDAGVVAHELTHLYFHSYFDEKNSAPPPWLDEGLASMLQDSALSFPDPRMKGPVLRAIMPMARLLKTRPAQDSPGDWVSAWYRQAQSVVWFIKRGHIDASFADFCAALRDGRQEESALSQTYGYDDFAAFEDAWRKWRPTKPVGALKGLGDQ